MNSLKIKALNIENFKGIGELSTEIKGDVIYVSGKNGAGKTSVLEAIYAAISKSRLPEKPIKDGEDKMTINLVLAGKDVELEITRTATIKGRNTLIVKENGKTIANARKLLDGLLSNISIDPFKFLGLSDKEQAEMMCKVCGINFDFEAHNLHADVLIEERKRIKRDMKSAKESRDAIELPDLPEDTNLDIAELNQQLKDANLKNSETQSKIDETANAKEEFTKLRVKLLALKEVANQEFDEKMVDTAGIEADIQTAIDNSAITSKIEMRKTYDECFKEAEIDLKFKEKEIKTSESDKAKSLKAFKAPVKGLQTDGKSLLLNDVPFSQASAAERIEVSAKLSMLASKDIKVINIKDASLLDDEMTKVITDVAKENGCQVFLEVVSNSDDVSLTFEEGDAVKAKGRTLLDERNDREEKRLREKHGDDAVIEKGMLISEGVELKAKVVDTQVGTTKFVNDEADTESIARESINEKKAVDEELEEINEAESEMNADLDAAYADAMAEDDDLVQIPEDGIVDIDGVTCQVTTESCKPHDEDDFGDFGEGLEEL